MPPTEQLPRPSPINWTTLLESSVLPSYYYLLIFYPLVFVGISSLPPATSTALWILVPLWLVNKCMQTLAGLCFLSLLVLVYFCATSAYIWLAGGYTSADADADAPTPAKLEDGAVGSPPKTTPNPLFLTLRTLTDLILNLSVVATYTLFRGVLSFESSALANATAAAVFVLHGLAALGVSLIAASALSPWGIDAEEQQRGVLGAVPLSTKEKEYMGEMPST